MTDTYGSDKREHETEQDLASAQEAEAIHEAPSDYEFSDEHAAVPDVDAEEDEGAIVTEDNKPPSRSPLLPIAAALGGIVLLGAVGWWQFGGGDAEPDMGMPALSAASVAPAPVLPAVAPEQALPTAPKMAASTMDAPVAPVDAAPVTAATPAVDAVAAALPAAAMHAEAVPAPVPAAPPSAVPFSIPPMPPAHPAPVAGAGPHDARLEALSARVDELQKALEQANQQLSQMANIAAASAPVVAEPSKEVQARIDHLEQQLAAMRHAPSSVSSASPMDMGDMMEAPAPVKKVATKAVKKNTSAPKAKKQTEKKPAVTYVLRAATPDQAWVASSASSSDLKQVQVGDTLPGIGRVTAIEAKDGAWSVVGTSGSIR